RCGMPTTWTRLCSMRTSSGAHSRISAATRVARSRTSRAVCATAGPELAATRLPPVPMPNGNMAVSPVLTWPSSHAAPSSAAELGGIETEPAGADVHQPLHHEHRLGPPGRAIRSVQVLRRDHARAGVAIVGDAVRAGQVVDRVRGEPVALERIGADVGDERGV